MKKSTSLQARIVKYIVGVIIGTCVITGLSFFDKWIGKGIIILAFSLATSAVGGLYACGFLRGRTEGGRARILLFIVFTYVLYTIVNGLVQFLFSIKWWVYLIIILFLTIIIIALWLIFIDKEVNYQQKQFNDSTKEFIKNINQDKVDNTNLNINSIVSVEIKDDSKNYYSTLYDIWNKYGKEGEWLKITNLNPEVSWVKIKKGPYGNNKFYGYIKMKHAREAINGEIYYANDKIWFI